MTNTMDSPAINYKDGMKERLERQEKKVFYPSYAEALRAPAPSIPTRPSLNTPTLITPEMFNPHIYTAPKKFEPKVFNGTTDGRIFACEMQQHLNTLTNVLNYQKALIWLSYMRGPRVRDWAKKMQYVAGLRIGQGVWSGYNDPAILPWFKQAFELGYKQTLEERSAVKELLKLRVKKGDVETYIRKFEILRRTVDWPEETIGTITQFQRRLSAMHTREIRKRKIPRPVTLKDWYAVARNQWKKTKTEEICKDDAHAITPIAPAPIVIRTVEVRPKISSPEAARWQQALTEQQTITKGRK